MKKHPIDDQMREAAWDELARLLIRGVTQKQAAIEMGFHFKTIYKWVSEPAFKAKMEAMRALVFDPPKTVTTEAVIQDIREYLKKEAYKAVQHMSHLMTHAEHERTQLKAAQELADRHPETQKTRNVNVQANVALFTPQDLVVMAAAAKEIRDGLIATPLRVESAESLALPIEGEPFEDRG